MCYLADLRRSDERGKECLAKQMEVEALRCIDPPALHPHVMQSVRKTFDFSARMTQRTSLSLHMSSDIHPRGGGEGSLSVREFREPSIVGAAYVHGGVHETVLEHKEGPSMVAGGLVVKRLILGLGFD